MPDTAPHASNSDISPAAKPTKQATQAGGQPAEGAMKRGLTSRTVQFIAIGATMGTGLFFGSGESIALAGPSVIFLYVLLGLVALIMLRAVGEFIYTDPTQHSFLSFLGRYLGAGWGHFAIWTYWLVILLAAMTELSALAQYFIMFFGLFGIDIASWGWAIQLGFVVVLVLLNLTSVKSFGETEFWMTMIKVGMIVAVFALAVVLVVIGFHYPTQTIIDSFTGAHLHSHAGRASLANIFAGYQIAPNGWNAFFRAFVMVFFSYGLIEFIGSTAAETEDPRTVIPHAVNGTVTKVILLCAAAVTSVLAIVPWRTFMTKANGAYPSPFIMMFRYIGMNWASFLILFVVVSAAASALNSLFYTAARNFYTLAQQSGSRVLKPFVSLSKQGVPARAVILSASIVYAMQFISMIPGMANSFVVFSGLASAGLVCIYVLTMIAHYRYRSSEDFMEDGFVLRAYRVWDIFALVMYAVVYATLYLSPETAVAAIIVTAWTVVFGFISHVIVKKRGGEVLEVPVS